MKILKYIKYLSLIERVVGYIESLKPGAEGLPIRPTYKGKEFEITIRRTK